MSEYEKPRPVTDLPLFAVEPQAPQRLTREPVRIESVRESNASKHRADIERGKPIAVFVANRDGKVIAETFRAEATRRGVRFDSDTGDQRGLCWISTMMGQLCREGLLQKRIRSDGSTVTEYSKEQHNDQVVYEAAATRREDAA